MDKIEAAIRQAYHDLSTKPQDWVRLVRLMDHKAFSPLYLYPVATTSAVQAVLIEMYRRGEIHLAPESNRKVITPADRLLAVTVGGEQLHLMAIWAD